MVTVRENQSYQFNVRGRVYSKKNPIEVTLNGTKVDAAIRYYEYGANVVIPATYITGDNLPAELVATATNNGSVVKRETLAFASSNPTPAPSTGVGGGLVSEESVTTALFMVEPYTPQDSGEINLYPKLIDYEGMGFPPHIKIDDEFCSRTERGTLFIKKDCFAQFDVEAMIMDGGAGNEYTFIIEVDYDGFRKVAEGKTSPNPYGELIGKSEKTNLILRAGSEVHASLKFELTEEDLPHPEISNIMVGVVVSPIIAGTKTAEYVIDTGTGGI